MGRSRSTSCRKSTVLPAPPKPLHRLLQRRIAKTLPSGGKQPEACTLPSLAHPPPHPRVPNAEARAGGTFPGVQRPVLGVRRELRRNHPLQAAEHRRRCAPDGPVMRQRPPGLTRTGATPCASWRLAAAPACSLKRPAPPSSPQCTPRPPAGSQVSGHERHRCDPCPRKTRLPAANERRQIIAGRIPSWILRPHNITGCFAHSSCSLEVGHLGICGSCRLAPLEGGRTVHRVRAPSAANLKSPAAAAA